MNKTILIGVGVLVVVIGGYFLLSGGYQAPEANLQQQPQLTVPVPGFEDVPETIVALKGETSSAKEISMVSGNLFFNPESITLTKDQPVIIAFQNAGTHTFTIDELNVNIPLRGSSPTVEFTPIKSGTFEYYCSVPGHREGGMIGSLKVE